VAGPSDRLFSLAVAGGLAVMGLWPLLAGRGVRTSALAVSGLVTAVGLVRPSLVGPVRRLATRVVLLVSAAVSAVVATLLFYLVVTPTGYVMRRRGGDSLGLRFDPDAETYWKLRQPPGPEPGTMSRQF